MISDNCKLSLNELWQLSASCLNNKSYAAWKWWWILPHLHRKTVIFPLFFHFMSASENSVIVCSPSCCSKPSFFYGTQKEMLERTTSSQSPLIFFPHIMKVNRDWRKEVMQVWSNMRVTDNMVCVDCPDYHQKTTCILLSVVLKLSAGQIWLILSQDISRTISEVTEEWDHYALSFYELLYNYWHCAVWWF